MKNLIEIETVSAHGTATGKTIINITQIVQIEDLSTSSKLSRIHFSNSSFIDVKMNRDEILNMFEEYKTPSC